MWDNGVLLAMLGVAGAIGARRAKDVVSGLRSGGEGFSMRGSYDDRGSYDEDSGSASHSRDGNGRFVSGSRWF